MTVDIAVQRPDKPICAIALGAELARLRRERGLSLRQLAPLLGMTAHSGLVDYERGLRVPPGDLLDGYARVFPADRDHLIALHRAAVRERGRRRANTAPDAPDSRTVIAMAEALENAARMLRATVAGMAAREEPRGS